MSLPDAFAQLEAEFMSAQPDVGKMERGITFQAIGESVADIFRHHRATALHSSTYMDGQERELLLIHHRAQRRYPRAVRLLINDAGLAAEDATKHALTGTELVAIPSRGLIRQRRCSMLEQGNRMFAIGDDGFMIQRPDEASIVNIRHGLGYRPDFPKDTPNATIEDLQKRQTLAAELILLLAKFQLGDSRPVDYLFLPQLTKS